jgi:hypothetical protein
MLPSEKRRKPPRTVIPAEIDGRSGILAVGIGPAVLSNFIIHLAAADHHLHLIPQAGLS